jgi:hypothetical protein
MENTAVHRMLMTFDVTDWPETARRRLAAAGADIVAGLAADNDTVSAAVEWTKETIQQLIGLLAAQGAYAQAHTFNEAIANGGEISRERVYEIGGYGGERSLKGFTRPIRRIVKQMQAQGLVPETAQVPIEPIYDAQISGYQRTQGFRLMPGIAELYLGDGQSTT